MANVGLNADCQYHPSTNLLYVSVPSMLCVILIQPGCLMPCVFSSQQVFNIFSGSVTFNVAGTEQHLSRGACAIVPPCKCHCVGVCLGGGTGVLVWGGGGVRIGYVLYGSVYLSVPNPCIE